MGCLGDIQDGAGNRLSTPSTPPAWHFLHECDVPVETQELPVSATFSKQNGGEALSADSCNLSYPATLRERNDSPDPIYQGCRPSEQYLSDGPFYEGDQCSECRCPPGQPHNPECDISCSPVVSCDKKDDATGCDEAAKVTDSVINVESCPECGTVTDIDYGACMDRCVDTNEEPAVETHEDLQGKDADKMVDTFDVPFRVQEFMFEELAEVQAEYLHDILKNHTPLIVEMARDRFRKGFAKYGSAAYLWDAETRLTNVLEELADSVVYLTTGAIE